MLNRSSKLTIALLGGLLAFALACSPSASAPKEQPSAPAEKAAPGEVKPKHGGTYLATTSRHNADPAIGQTPYGTWYYTGEPMLRRHYQTYELQPATFESWQVSPDGKEIIFKVRQGMRFHNKPPANGREVEARDLVYVLKSATGQQYPELSPTRFPRKASFLAMEDAVALDKHTVKVTLKNPSVSFLHALADYRSTWVYPEGLREAFPGGVDSLAVTDPKRDIGPGPFILTKFETDVVTEYERNPDYYQKGYPYLDKIRLVVIEDESARQAAFVAGNLHTLGTSTVQSRNFVVKTFPQAQIITYEPGSCWHRYSLNVTRKPFDDYRVRRALYLTMDKKKIGEVKLGEWEGKPLWVWPGPIPFVFKEARPQEDLAKHPLYQGLTPENVAEAKRLLKEAGYEGGFEFTLNLDRGRLDEAQIIERDWANHLGVKMNLKVVDSETHRALAARGEYEAQSYCHIFDVTAVAHLAQAAHTQGGRNYGRNSDPKLDALLDEAERTLDPVKYQAVLRQAEDYYLDHGLPMLMVYQNFGQTAIAPGVKGLEYGRGTSVGMGVYKWWLDK